MADGVLVDSDVLVDHLRGARSISASVPDHWQYSIVSRCELFAGTDRAQVVRALLCQGRERGVTSDVAERAGRIRRITGISTPDALIAATALVSDLVLVTRNVKHFRRVPALRLEVPS